MPIGGAALPPAGFLALCARSPLDCVVDGDALPDLAVLESSANRRLWADLFQPRSAPAALPRTDVFDWSTVFVKATPGPVIDPPAAGADDVAVSVPGVLIAATTATFDAPGQMAIRGMFKAALDALDIRFGTPAGDAATAAGDRADISDGAVTIPLGIATVADVGAAAPSAADVAVAAVEVAAVSSSDGALSPTDLPNMTPVAIHAESKTVADPIIGPDLVKDEAPEETAVFNLDRAGWRLVNGVNRRLNRQIRQTSDDRLYGMEDFWNRPEGRRAQGDCEDYVLAKRAALIANGVPAGALSIAIVETRWGESHAVLLLASDRGEFILDSLSPWLVRWDRADYVWRERQLPGRPFDWVRVAV
jgi:predicted transglutaminase-like cysteine proteinase